MKGGLIFLKLFKKMGMALLILAMLLALPTSGVRAGLEDEKAASEQQIAEFQKLIADANGNLNVIVAQIESVQAKINAIDSNLKKINNEITVIEGSIAAKEAEIAEAIRQFDLSKASFYENLRSKYEEGDINYTSIVLNSEDLTDFINYNEYYRIVREKEQVRINQIKAERAALEVQKADLEVQKKSLADKQDEIVSQKKQQDIEKQKLASQKSYFASLAAQYKSELAKEQAELNSINAQIAAAKAQYGSYTYMGNGVFRWPVPASNRVTSDYGWRGSPITGDQEFHKGIDIGAASGSNVVAAEEGRVLMSYYSSSFGNTVVIDHGSNIYTLYAHLSYRSVAVGQIVAMGQSLGGVGSTGWSTGPHLHFQVTNSGNIFSGVVDPNIYLGFR